MKKKAKRKAPEARRALLYKVVELSTVDEAAIERTLNEWVGQGWALDGIQFAMRESSKRPSMAFVFFTREGPPVTDRAGEEEGDRGRSIDSAHRRLRHLADDQAKMPPAVSAWERLAQLADDGDDET